MERIGDYELLEVLGQGAAGTVHRAYSQRLEREVALKVVPWSLANDIQRRRFEREAQALSKLRHPNVIAIHEVGSLAHGAWLAMDLIPGGRSLEDSCADIDALLGAAIASARAWLAAHDQRE